ncbi:MAG: flagellar basal body L-ring protein FlgH [Pseudomonadota bacterium]
MSRFAVYAKSVGLIAGMLALQACNTSFHDIGAPKQLTPIEYDVPIEDVLVPYEPAVIEAQSRVSMEDNSLWNNEESIYFRDTRAFDVGDILTVDISINDSAKLDNSSESQTDITGSVNGSTDLTLGSLGTLPPVSIGGTANGNLDVERGGTVDRTEQINLQIAAVVTQSAGNGNLRIQGSQEVRVNHEIRILTVHGVVRTKDIRPDNTIPYEKIAEARITYGGHNSRRVPRKTRPWNLFASLKPKAL